MDQEAMIYNGIVYSSKIENILFIATWIKSEGMLIKSNQGK